MAVTLPVQDYDIYLWENDTSHKINCPCDVRRLNIRIRFIVIVKYERPEHEFFLSLCLYEYHYDCA